MEDKELLADFVIESNEHLADIENQFLAIEEAAPDVDANLVNEVFRAIHSIKGAAGFMGLTTVNDLAHNLENVLNMIRNEELAPNSKIVDVLLKGADRLKSLIEDVENSNGQDVSDHVTALEAIANGQDIEEAPATEVEEEPVVESAPAEAATPATDDEEDIDAKIEKALQEAQAKRIAEKAKKTSDASSSSTKSTQPDSPAQKPVQTEPISKKTPAADSEKVAKPAVEANIRVAVGVLDSLMNLAGELVLSRNQLVQAVSTEEKSGIDAIAARVDQVTSELQEAIMQTRMQQIGSVFGKFPRVIRDLSSKLGKQCDLEIEGKDVEVDKTIIEAIGDPLTHLIRNSVDHGVESPEDRTAAGKSAKGKILLRAFYQAGKVRIEIQDDGGGIDPNILKEKAVKKGIINQEKADTMSDREAIRLIFAPGFSTAAKVTDVSGRGVGMDVVRTNIAKLGGTVDVESTLGQGTNIVVMLPLTLAIVPSLIVQVGQDRFAIPQVGIVELVRVRENERQARLGKVNNAEVLRLRGQLLPLVRLSQSLGCKSQEEIEAELTGATNIIVVDTGQTQFGLVVDALHDSEEIVVKPLGRHHKDCRCLSGATILGDGHVALILDIPGIAVEEELNDMNEEDLDVNNHQDAQEESEDEQSVLLFMNSPNDHFAVPMDIISRLERVRIDQIDSVAGREVLQYRNSTLPLIRTENVISAESYENLEWIYVVVFEAKGTEVGLIAPHLKDIRRITTHIDTTSFTEPGVIGSLVIEEKTIRMLSLFDLTKACYPDWFVEDELEISVDDDDTPPLVLLAEDSGFFRSQVKKMFEEKAYEVIDCEDGQIAWDRLNDETEQFDVIVTDIEMPNMNGFELCDRIKSDSRFKDLPVIALTSLAATSDMERGIAVGIDDYQIKMDREKLLNSLNNFVGHSKNKKASKRQTAGSHS